MRSRRLGYDVVTRDGGSREMERSFLLHASLETLAVSRRAVDETLWYLGHQRVEIARIAVDELSRTRSVTVIWILPMRSCSTSVPIPITPESRLSSRRSSPTHESESPGRWER